MLRLALPQLAPEWLSRAEGLAKVIDTINSARLLAQKEAPELVMFLRL